MTADVRTFKASNMQEALNIVRQEMGPDAVILNTRELPAPRLLSLWRSKDRVEVTAGLGINVSARASTERSAAENASGSRTTTLPPRSNTRPATSTLPSAIAKRSSDPDLADPPPLLSNRTLSSPPAQRTTNPSARTTSLPPATPARRTAPARTVTPAVNEEDFTLESVIPRVAPPPRAPRAAPVPHPTGGRRAEGNSPIAEQLTSIRQLVERLDRRTARPETTSPVAPEYEQLGQNLRSTGMDPELILDYIAQVSVLDQRGPRVPELSQERLRAIIESDLPCSGPIALTRGTVRTVALVGPTGVGKTTTIAKLAASHALCRGIKTGLITVDTYRIAAVEQLRTYAEIIDLPMKVVTSADEMRDAREAFQELDLILIDTAGRSPRDENQIQELVRLLHAAHVDETHLVLSLVASPRALEHAVERFLPTRMTSLLFTKLDEALHLGPILNLTRKFSLPISYLTTGQDVPDDFETADTSRLARLILGEDCIDSTVLRRESSF